VPPTRPAPRSGEPVAPRLPAELSDIDASALASRDEWDRVCVTGAIEAAVIPTLDVSESRWRGVVAHGLEVRGLTLTDVIVEGCDFSGGLMRGAVLRRVELRDCRLSGLVFDASTLHDVVFRSCKLDTASLRSLDAQRVVFDGSVLRDADLSAARFKDTRITASDLRGARCAKVAGRGLRLHGSDLAGLRDADALRGVVIDETQVAALAQALFDALGVTVQAGDDSSFSS
jgi:uncharacterized protein YjbI with pentapeptide repeats